MLAALVLSLFMSVELGPAVGTTIPEVERFENVMGKEGATIVFVRSVDWCPYCKKQVMDLGDEADAFAKEGRPLVIVSYDADMKQRVFMKKNKVRAKFVADKGSEIIKAFGILNENHAPGSRVYGIPHPAVFVVDENGVVDAKLYEEDYATNNKSYKNRPAAETILEAVRSAD